MSIVLVPKHAKLGQGFTRAEAAKADEHPGRRTDGSQSPASWIADLVDTKKLILLCTFCRHNFNPRKHNFRKAYIPDATGKSSGYEFEGMCDACKQQTGPTGTAFVHEETYALTYIDPVVMRRNARAAAKALPAWRF